MSTDRTEPMLPPDNPRLPFFAYGIFKPGQLAFLQICDLVGSKAEDSIRGGLWLRNGMSVYDPEDGGVVEGVVLTFQSGKEPAAYQAICNMEPQHHYGWYETKTMGGVKVNCLKGRALETLRQDHVRLWSDLTRKDEVFDEAGLVIQAGLKELDELEKLERSWRATQKTGTCSHGPSTGHRPPVDEKLGCARLFRAEMYYMLLWSMIERYLSMRYRLTGNTESKLDRMSDDKHLRSALSRYCGVVRKEVHRSDNPSAKKVLNPDRLGDALDYYYQIRCNMVHHGKDLEDYNQLRDALVSLWQIFDATLNGAYAESQRYVAR